ncbi:MULTISPECIES: GGDEF domain-containing protein [unclassified Pseudonocardia]|uniref:sensor domain-containing diguanylate cyclase n=1 Tax=unclassified Pseudonocardia TaxID=2619320 RepID=UPI001AD039F7|nr:MULTISPECIES: GGDEF domain-containing protein [unclassified Pseudonocardia]MBN9097740.1 GGDEF domain-containing protein [Pseudonocardia sp.]
MRRWPVWQEPARTLYPVLMVELTAVVLGGVLLARQPRPALAEVVAAVVLVLAGVAHAEIALGVERARRRIAHGNIVDLSSIWTFAAVIVLPAFDAGLVAALVYGYFWVRAWRLRTRLYRQLFSMSTVVLACFAGSAVLHYVIGPGSLIDAAPAVVLPGVLLAIVVYTCVNTCLVAGAIALSSREASVSTMFASWDENMLELATLCLGALTGAALLINPLLALGVVPPLVVLHRAALVRQLEKAANTDAKTGLLTIAAWYRSVEAIFRRGAGRGPRPTAVLVVDLDHFKSINDTYGHLAGDHVLTAAAHAVGAEVRSDDLVGRFGGEEFVVLLTADDRAGPVADAVDVAERIRRRIGDLRVEIATPDGPLTVSTVSASVGVSVVGPGPLTQVSALIHAADAALFVAKRAGRNQVRLAGPAEVVRDPAPHNGAA